jgi:hypothetical protein
MGTIVRISTRLAKKEFRFYLAKGYCILASRSEGDLDKMKYLSLSTVHEIAQKRHELVNE